MAKNKTIKVENFEIVLYSQNNGDFISLTDMVRYRDEERTNYIIQNWLRTRYAIEFCGLWEQLNNASFKRIEFDAFKTAQEWRCTNQDKEGNIRDYANIEQLVVLSNMESINAVFIRQGLTQSVRLMQLNKIAITQMTSLMNSRQLKRLKKQE